MESKIKRQHSSLLYEHDKFACVQNFWSHIKYPQCLQTSFASFWPIGTSWLSMVQSTTKDNRSIVALGNYHFRLPFLAYLVTLWLLTLKTFWRKTFELQRFVFIKTNDITRRIFREQSHLITNETKTNLSKKRDQITYLAAPHRPFSPTSR